MNDNLSPVPDEVPNPDAAPKSLTELRNEMLQIGGTLAIHESNVAFYDAQLSETMTDLNHTRAQIHELLPAFDAAIDAYVAAKAAGLK